MGNKSAIEWTDSTWNPIRGCSRVSEGCRHCYAETQAAHPRLGGPGKAYEGLTQIVNGHAQWTGEVRFIEKHLLDPLRWGPVIEHVPTCDWNLAGLRPRKCGCPSRGRRIFVNSMSDLFHENVTDEMRDKIFAVMALCPQHTFQVLTKRPARMAGYLSLVPRQQVMARWGFHASQALHSYTGKHDLERNLKAEPKWPLPNVWLGVSIENQKAANERIPLLLQTPAAIRFLSIEPLLGEVSLRWKNSTAFGVAHPRHLKPEPDASGRVCTDEYDGLRELDWIICGGESGHGARPMHPAWARFLRDQCLKARVPFFFKQWGEWVPHDTGKLEHWDASRARFMRDDGRIADWSGSGVSAEEGHDPTRWSAIMRVGKEKAGSLLDGVEWKQFPEVRA